MVQDALLAQPLYSDQSFRVLGDHTGIHIGQLLGPQDEHCVAAGAARQFVDYSKEHQLVDDLRMLFYGQFRLTHDE